MGYLSKEDPDVFISYTHDDDERSGWVTRFCRDLRMELNAQMRAKEKRRKGVRVEVWRDDELRRHGVLKERLKKEAESAGILLIIVSPNYLLSPICKKEGEWFAAEENKDKDVRVFIVEIKETDKEATDESEGWPDFLLDDEGSPLLHRKVYDESGITWPMTMPDGNTDPRMDRQIQQLSSEICDELWKLKRQKPSPRSRVKPSAQEQRLGSIYLAFAAGDLQEYERENLKRILADNKVDVLPDPEPDTPDLWVRALDEQLPRCRRFVQLLGRSRGASSSGHRAGIVGEQYETAVLSKPVSLWLHPSVDVETVADEEYRDFLAELQPELNRATLEKFAQQIVDELKRLGADKKETSPHITLFAIDAEIRDFDDARGLAAEIEAVYRDKPVMALVPDESTSPTQRRSIREECEAIIILWGKSKVGWFLGQFRSIFDERGKRDKRGNIEFESAGLALYPPPGKNCGFDPKEKMNVLDRTDPDNRTDGGQLRAFCDSLIGNA